MSRTNARTCAMRVLPLCLVPFFVACQPAAQTNVAATRLTSAGTGSGFTPGVNPHLLPVLEAGVSQAATPNNFGAATSPSCGTSCNLQYYGARCSRT